MAMLRKKATPYVDARERTWAAVRGLARGGRRGGDHDQPFKIADIAATAGVSIAMAQPYLLALWRGGFLRAVPPERCGTETVYYLQSDPGADAPRVRADGVIMPPPDQQRLWAAIAPLGAFSAAELAAACGGDVPVRAISAYISQLHAAGYLVVAEPAVVKGANAARRPARYRLKPSHATGPKAPMVRQGRDETEMRRKRVWDPNVGREIGPGDMPLRGKP